MDTKRKYGHYTVIVDKMIEEAQKNGQSLFKLAKPTEYQRIYSVWKRRNFGKLTYKTMQDHTVYAILSCKK